MTLGPHKSASAEGGHWAADPQAPLSTQCEPPGAPEPMHPFPLVITWLTPVSPSKNLRVLGVNQATQKSSSFPVTTPT